MFAPLPDWDDIPDDIPYDKERARRICEEVHPRMYPKIKQYHELDLKGIQRVLMFLGANVIDEDAYHASRRYADEMDLMDN